MTKLDGHIEIYGSTIFTQQIIHKATRANSPTLVFLHEGLGSIEQWRDFPVELCEATGLNALLYDREGYGKSAPISGSRGHDYMHKEAWEVLPKLLEQTELDKVILVGHSDGGTIALLYAARFKQQVVGVITEAAHVFVEDVTLKGIRNAQLTYEITPLRSRLARYHGDKTPQMFSSWADTWLSDDFRNWNIEEHLKAVQCPILAIQGVEDYFGTEKQILSIVDKSTGRAEKLLIHGCGHTPHFQAPKKVMPAMTGFIQNLMREM